MIYTTKRHKRHKKKSIKRKLPARLAYTPEDKRTLEATEAFLRILFENKKIRLDSLPSLSLERPAVNVTKIWDTWAQFEPGPDLHISIKCRGFYNGREMRGKNR